jgi:hypothetical protein
MHTAGETEVYYRDQRGLNPCRRKAGLLAIYPTNRICIPPFLILGAKFKNMKKTMILPVLVLLLALDAAAQRLAPLDPSPADIAYLRPGGRGTVPVAKVVYSRPQKKGRTMIGATEPFGKVWRVGANETTEIKFYKDVTFGDKEVKAGTYALYAIPGEKDWTLILN